MASEYVMPKLAMAMNEGTVNDWLVAHGEKVEEGQAFVIIETEKVSYDCEAPMSGYLCVVAQPGDTVACEELLGYFCDSPEEADELAAKAKSSVTSENLKGQPEPIEESPSQIVNKTNTAESVPANTSCERIIASPLAKKIAKDNNLDLRPIAGTGPNGRIVKKDVENVLTNPQSILSHSTQPEPSEKIRIPITGVRKTIADRMQQSLAQTAQLSSAWESDITDLLAMRSKLLQKEEQLGTRISVNALLIKAICYAISQVPIANACRDKDEIIVFNNVNMGIAVAMPGMTEFDSALMVAVLHNVQTMGLVQIDTEMKSLISRVRNNQTTKNDLSGSTITLSSTAGIAPPGMTTSPILNTPNAALIGPSTPIERPMIVDGKIVPRTMLPISFTFDHCLLDGEPAARFMKALNEALENPELLLA